MLLALVCTLGMTALWYPAPAEAIGIVVHRTDLTPTLTFKKPANFRTASVLLIAMDPKEGIVWEAIDITASGAFQFETQK